MKAVLANMGFVLQMSGIFLAIPIIASFVYGETNATIGLFIAAMVFLGCGFLFNALCERKDLDSYSSNALIVLSFVLLGVIGSIPYIYISGTPGIERVVDGLFESVSGYTTTGFTIIADVDLLPRSILLYRALTQFIGGIGIVLILLVFFYSEEKLVALSKSLGLSSNHKIRKTFFLILGTYIGYDIIVTAVLYLLGYHDVVTITEYVLATISTGGFSPGSIQDLVTQKPFGLMIILGMLMGASNFVDLTNLVRVRIWSFLKSEAMAFLLVVAGAVIAVQVFFHLGWYQTVFHVVSAMSTTGFSYIDINGMGETFMLVFAALMLIGGTTFSTAGGLKMQRLFLLLKLIPKVVVEVTTGREKKVSVFGREFTDAELVQTVFASLLLVVSTLAFAFLVHLHGFPFVDSLFEVVSAITCTGLGVGIAAPSASVAVKLIFTLVMLIGRVELVAVLIFLSFRKA